MHPMPRHLEPGQVQKHQKKMILRVMAQNSGNGTGQKLSSRVAKHQGKILPHDRS